MASSQTSRRLEGRRALVTGGGRGIGRAIAESLAAEGAKVVVCGRGLPALEEVARAIGGEAMAVDLSDREDTDRFLGELAAQPRIDILVNNAGIAASEPLKNTSDELWDRVFELNVTAGYRLLRGLVPPMIAGGYGRVISVASNAGVSGYAYTSAYCASKHAVVGYIRALAVEFAKSPVTFNAVCPGFVDTDIVEAAVDRIAETTGREPEMARDALRKLSPQGRIFTPEEVAHLVTSLCPDAARGINGQALVLDGGQVLK